LGPASETLVFMQRVLMPDAMKKLLESVYSKSILKIAAVDQVLTNYPIARLLMTFSRLEGCGAC
jgi:hypothetical protein